MPQPVLPAPKLYLPVGKKHQRNDNDLLPKSQEGLNSRATQCLRSIAICEGHSPEDAGLLVEIVHTLVGGVFHSLLAGCHQVFASYTGDFRQSPAFAPSYNGLTIVSPSCQPRPSIRLDREEPRLKFEDIGHHFEVFDICF